MSKTIEEKIEIVVAWLRQKAAEAGAAGLVVGVSGGIDSAVVACLNQRAFPQNSLGVVLPCASAALDGEYAAKLIAACGLQGMTVDLTAVHDQLLGQVTSQLKEREISPGRQQMTSANLKARLRMSTLYALANSLNYLVVGTDNADETYTGYFTKYGDGGVDLLPIANLTKGQVREWARILGVPQEIIDRPPTAGLWADQTDEKEMGTTYAVIDAFLQGQPIPDRDREIIERMHRLSEHKRQLPPKAEI